MRGFGPSLFEDTMIISPDGLWRTDVVEDDGNVIIQHSVDNTLVAEQAKHLRDYTDRGFTVDRQMQCAGYIPFDLWQKHNLSQRPIEDAFKLLDSHEEFAPFRVGRRNTGHSGKIIIK